MTVEEKIIDGVKHIYWIHTPEEKEKMKQEAEEALKKMHEAEAAEHAAIEAEVETPEVPEPTPVDEAAPIEAETPVAE